MMQIDLLNKPVFQQGHKYPARTNKERIRRLQESLDFVMRIQDETIVVLRETAARLEALEGRTPNTP